MNKEIKEILVSLNSQCKSAKGCINSYFKIKDIEQLLDYITDLQQENEEWDLIFDTFSKRPYAHRYLEEKRKKLGNDKIIGLDSEMIYKDYYALQQENQTLKENNMNMQEEMARVWEENERLKERYDLVCKITEERKNKWLSLNEENDNIFKTLKDYKTRCEKAISLIDKYLEIVDNPDINMQVVKDILQGESNDK